MKLSVSVLMQFTPEGIDVQNIIKKIQETQAGIENVHHVHLWQLDDHSIHLEAHLNFNTNITLAECSVVLDSLEKVLLDGFGITHTTFQCEYNRCRIMNVIV